MSVHDPPPQALSPAAAPMSGVPQLAQTAPASVLALPAELIEHILILTALSGYPTAIAAFAGTCRAFAALVYHSPDHHLWREVFLATFDDPRRLPASPSDPFDWGVQYRARVWAAALFKRGSASPASSRASFPGSEASQDEYDEVAQYTRALETLVEVAHTALPYPPTICAVPAPGPSCAVANTVPGSAPQPGFPSYPIFPPPPCLCLSALPFPCADEGSRNIKWLETVFNNGLPPPLARRMSGSRWEGGILGDDLDEKEARLMQALGKVVAFTGFRPARCGAGSSGSSTGSGCRARSSGSDASMSGDEEDSASGSNSGSESDDACAEEPTKDTVEDGEETTDPPSTTPARLASETFIAGASVVAGLSLDTSAAAQARRARRLARMRAYNLRFLDPARSWGPFLRADPAASLAAAPAPLLEQEESGKGKGQEGSEKGSCGRATREVDSDDEESDWAPLPPPTLRKETWTRTRLPPPAALSPDWTFLAAARVVVEANLREAVGAAQLAGLSALDGLRAGSAPLEIGACAVRCGEQAGKSGGRGVDVGPTQVQGEGWDWAGVTGVWRRCICWLDYRDLISHNVRPFSPLLPSYR